MDMNDEFCLLSRELMIVLLVMKVVLGVFRDTKNLKSTFEVADTIPDVWKELRVRSA
jgi:hypothetical protein